MAFTRGYTMNIYLQYAVTLILVNIKLSYMNRYTYIKWKIHNQVESVKHFYESVYFHEPSKTGLSNSIPRDTALQSLVPTLIKHTWSS